MQELREIIGFRAKEKTGKDSKEAIMMSDDFAVCPKCGALEPGWETFKIKFVRCKVCRKQYPEVALQWTHVEYE